MGVIPLRKRQADDQSKLERGRLAARPKLSSIPSGSAETRVGLQRLELGKHRDGFLYVPESYRVDRPAPLILMLHGAGGNGQHGIAPFLSLADEARTILLSPDSRGQTWDFLLNGFGPDVDFIDEALELLFEQYAIDRSHIAIEGFSDGASYALSLGIANGDLFSHVIAFSPGFMAAPTQQGSPRVFISHGIDDSVLPIERCSRNLAPKLDQAGYPVEYIEFDGGHVVPLEIARNGMEWFLGTRLTKS